MMYFGACYYPEHWTPDQAKNHIPYMKRAGINVVRMGEFAWSLIGATKQQPARLSLHGVQALPLATTHPFLTVKDRLQVPIGGSLVVGDWVPSLDRLS